MHMKPNTYHKNMPTWTETKCQGRLSMRRSHTAWGCLWNTHPPPAIPLQVLSSGETCWVPTQNLLGHGYNGHSQDSRPTGAQAVSFRRSAPWGSQLHWVTAAGNTHSQIKGTNGLLSAWPHWQWGTTRIIPTAEWRISCRIALTWHSIRTLFQRPALWGCRSY